MSQETSEAQAFLSENSALAYDDATESTFWDKAHQVATRIGGGYRFDDGSELLVDPMSCSIEATSPAMAPRPRERG